MPTEYNEIADLISVHESYLKAQVQLVFYVGLQIATGNNPAPELQVRLTKKIIDFIQGVKKDPGLFARQDWQNILCELLAVRVAVGGNVALEIVGAVAGVVQKINK